MASIPVDELQIIRRFGPHTNVMRGQSLSTSTEPEKLSRRTAASAASSVASN